MFIKIFLAKSAGFCFGVKRAIAMTKDSSKKHSNIEMLGDIVHNNEVISEIKQLGIKKVNKLEKGKDKHLIIRAHGIPSEIIQQAKQKGYKIIDATCPMVKEIHKIASRFEREERKIIIIGDRKHAEVQGIIGNIKTKPIIIKELTKSLLTRIKKINKAGAVVQSTQDLKKVEKIFSILQKEIKDIKLANTICQTTREKQNEIRKIPLLYNLMLIIGSKKSANTKRLYQISKSLNKKSYWIQSEKDIKKEWFKNTESIGITAGASTPEITIRKVITKIKEILK